MKSVVCQNQDLRVVDRPAPAPKKGQVLIGVLRCGICGSDLHLRRHSDEMQHLMVRTGYDHFPSASDEVVFGHEFCGEILAFGPGTSSNRRSEHRYARSRYYATVRTSICSDFPLAPPAHSPRR